MNVIWTQHAKGTPHWARAGRLGLSWRVSCSVTIRRWLAARTVRDSWRGLQGVDGVLDEQGEQL